MFGFNVVFLSTKVMFNEVVEVIINSVDEETTNMVKTYLKSTYFIFHCDIHEETCGVAIDYLISLMVANVHMDHFKNII